MAEVREIEMPGPNGPIPARLYVPPLPAPDAAAPLLVYYHGGGWVIGDLDMYDDLCRLMAAAAGCMVLSVDYRLAPEHPFPQPLEDAFAAFEWTVANADSLGADPKRIGVGGDSAGGNMAAVVSQMAVEGGGARPAMQLLFYPVTDAVEDTRSRQLFSEGFILTRGRHGQVRGGLRAPGRRRVGPADLDPPVPGPERPAARLRRHRRLRPAARRGRGLRAADA